MAIKILYISSFFVQIHLFLLKNLNFSLISSRFAQRIPTFRSKISIFCSNPLFSAQKYQLIALKFQFLVQIPSRIPIFSFKSPYIFAQKISTIRLKISIFRSNPLLFVQNPNFSFKAPYFFAQKYQLFVQKFQFFCLDYPIFFAQKFNILFKSPIFFAQ